jgi:hypothetical protein
MVRGMQKPCVGVAAAIVFLFVSGTASANRVPYQCLDNQLFRVGIDLVAQRGWGFVQRSHRQHIPLESRLTCFAFSQGKRSS